MSEQEKAERLYRAQRVVMKAFRQSRALKKIKAEKPEISWAVDVLGIPLGLAREAIDTLGLVSEGGTLLGTNIYDLMVCKQGESMADEAWLRVQIDPNQPVRNNANDAAKERALAEAEGRTR